MEVALVKLAGMAMTRIPDLTRIDEIPFDSDRKRMSTIHNVDSMHAHVAVQGFSYPTVIAFVKGAPYRMPVTFRRKTGFILLDQMRTLDKTHLVKRVGITSDKTLADVLRTLQEVFAE